MHRLLQPSNDDSTCPGGCPAARAPFSSRESDGRRSTTLASGSHGIRGGHVPQAAGADLHRPQGLHVDGRSAGQPPQSRQRSVTGLPSAPRSLSHRMAGLPPPWVGLRLPTMSIRLSRRCSNLRQVAWPSKKPIPEVLSNTFRNPMS